MATLQRLFSEGTYDSSVRQAIDGNFQALNTQQAANVAAIAVNAALIAAPVSASAPATATSAGVAGAIAYDATHIYVCVATNVWVRATLATF